MNDKLTSALTSVATQAEKIKQATAQTTKQLSAIKNQQPGTAPKWLIFPSCIINCDTIIAIQKYPDTYYINIDCKEGKNYKIPIDKEKFEKTWEVIQKAYAYGVTADDQKPSNPV